MAVQVRIQSENNTGFGTNSNQSGGRFYGLNGRPNVERRGVHLLDRFSWYHTMLALSRTKFILLLFAAYILINLVFATVYYVIGVDHLEGIHKGSALKNFAEVFFFSTQTFTTVGYGRISPTGFLTSTVAMFEAFLGLLSFAIATGLFYGRFSRPQAFIRFSDNALIAPYKEGIALMFRLATFKNNFLSEAEVRLTLAIIEEINGTRTNKFYPLQLEISKVNALTLNWTVVHPIDEKSPLFNMSIADMEKNSVEIIVFVKAFDDVFANTVMTRNSYVAKQVIWGGKFKTMYYPNENRTRTILNLHLLNAYDKVDIPEPVSSDRS
jgi:inward rectifier potassium channel